MPFHYFVSALALCAGLIAPQAHACTTSETGGVLLSSSTQIVASTSLTAQGALNYTCGPVVLSVLAGTPRLRGQLQAATTGLTLKNGSHSIPYQIYSLPNYSGTYTGGVLAVNLLGSEVLGLLNGAGATVPIYIKTTPTANIPAGTYTDTIQVTWTAFNICEGLVNVGGLCLGTLENRTLVSSLIVSLTVTNDCTITAPAVDFGSAPLAASFPTVSQSISLLCSRGMSYTVGLSTGNHASAGRRQMASGTSRLQYDLYKSDNTVWGSALASSRATSPAPADGVTAQTIPYTARVYTDQANPPPGVYTDNVVVDVSF